MMIHANLLVRLFAVLCAVLLFGMALRRRRILKTSLWRSSFLTLLDAASPALALGVGIAGLLALGSSLPLTAAAVLGESIAWLAISYYVWRESARTLQFQRPYGIAFGQLLVLAGAVHLLFLFLQRGSATASRLFSVEPITAAASLVVGAALLLWIVPRFLHTKEEHRILEQTPGAPLATQPEYHPATPECPHPERWRMFDSMAAEVEILNFLECLVTTIKPRLVVETGTFTGLSTLRMAAGMKQNGFGKIISCELDPAIFARAKLRIEASELARWIELRNESSLETNIEGTIDILFCDSDIPIREQEVRRFLPQISPYGLILMHDASSHTKIVREAALRLEQEGLLSVALFPTPRGLVVAQKRHGRR